MTNDSNNTRYSYASASSGIAYCDDSLFLILSWTKKKKKKNLCDYMFPYEDSEIVSVCLSVPREKKSP